MESVEPGSIRSSWEDAMERWEHRKDNRKPQITLMIHSLHNSERHWRKHEIHRTESLLHDCCSNSRLGSKKGWFFP